MERLSRMDGLRGILAVYILTCHALSCALVPPWLGALFNHGEAAVDLFFALSGLVVSHSLERHHYRFWPFINGRAGRLLPVYFTVLALAVGLQYLGSPLTALPFLSASAMAGSFWAKAAPDWFAWHVAAHVFLIQGIIPQGILAWAWITVLGPAWSLSAEWQFYIFMALVLTRLNGTRRVMRFAYLMLGLGICYRAAAPLLPGFWQFSRAFLPDAAPYFALGLASAVWMRNRNPVPFLICLVTVFTMGLLSPVPGKALIPVGWTVVLLAQRNPQLPLLPKLLDSRAAQYLGAISYPLYLINKPVQRACAMLIAPLAHGSADRFALLWLPAALLLPIAAATLLHHGIEAPVMRWSAMKSKGTRLFTGAETGRRIFSR